MSEGLIGDWLLDRILFIGGSGDPIPEMRTDVSRFVVIGTPHQLLTRLRSDETREALVRASFEALGTDPDKALDWEFDLHRDVVDAIVRALAGNGEDASDE